MKLEKRDFLVEIGTEELPPKALRALAQSFASGLEAGLDKAALAHLEVRSFASPRRLAVLVRRLAASQPDQRIERRGPPLTAAFDALGQATRAAQAFAASCGVPLEALERREEAKGAFLHYAGVRPGAAATELLPALIEGALAALPIPRRMRWGAGEAQFVRPVHWIVMLYGKEVVPATLFEVASGDRTRGHRFHAPRPLRISSPAAYERTLRTRGYVLADFEARRATVLEQVQAAAGALGGRALVREALLDEVTALVEWPVPLAGRFEDRFLSLPREVLISTLENHQRYFPVEGANGGLMPCFVAVANIESREPAKVVQGNERVVRPRLSDAAFFWEQDRKIPLRARIAALDAVTFQGKLGSLGDKARRIRRLTLEIAPMLALPAAPAERAAQLCKCDLLTALVGEFPELQGIMGTHYALADGEEREVALAIGEHYRPRAAGDELPQTPAGTVLAIADKLDTLAGIFAIGEKPSGTKDPFGLRRAAIGLVRILIEKRLELDLSRLALVAVALAGEDIAARSAAAGKAAPVPAQEATAREVYDYVLERLRAYYLESAGAAVTVTPEMFDAVLATRPVSPLDFDARLRALSAFLALPEASSLTAANRRVANILRKAEPESRERPGSGAGAAVDRSLLEEPAEIGLFEAMSALGAQVSAATGRREYASALGSLAQLKPVVDAFFDRVMVMVEDPRVRANRLALLGRMRELFAGVADLSRLPG
jgi:glycyl-tRNA synthetase beta chain